MSYFEDLSPFRYYDEDPYSCGFERVLSVGWIDFNEDKKCEFPKGEVFIKFLSKLKELIADKNRKSYVNYMGWHECCLCDSKENSSIFSGDIYIPFEQKHIIYVAPVGIVHYIEKHNYLPPKDFIEAVIGTKTTVIHRKWHDEHSNERDNIVSLHGKEYEELIKYIDYRFFYFIKMNDIGEYTLKNPEFSRENAPWRIEHEIISNRLSEEREAKKSIYQKELEQERLKIRKIQQDNPEEFKNILKESLNEGSKNISMR